MNLWPEEFEGLRAEARAMAEAIVEAYSGAAGGGDGGGDPVAAGRQSLAAMEITSPSGTDELVAGVPCRVFRPAAPSRGTYVHFHGGAMIMGSPRMNDADNAGLCERLRITVVSVDYRLAPEHPFPAGSDDCLAVVAEVLRTTADPVVLGGESAGGYFTALTALRVRDELGAEAIDRIHGLNLVFGVFDLSGTPSALGARPSDVPDILSDDMSEWVNAAYAPGRSRLELRDPAISPLWADLSNLPPALFSVGSADHLFDDSLFMHARYLGHGNDAELAVYPDCVHGFVSFPMELAKRATERIDAFLDGVFSQV